MNHKVWLLYCTVFLVLATGLSPTSAKAEEFSKFQELAKWPLGGSGGWDYLTADSESRHLYVARDNRIMVVDLDSGKLIGEVKDVNGAHGVALVPQLGLGFATAGRAGTVIAFDTKSLKVMSEIKVGEKPDAILFDTFSNKIFVFNGISKSVSVIDPPSKKITSTITLSGKPEFAVTDKKGRVYVNIEDRSAIAVIDTKSFKVISESPLTPCEEPTGISIDPTQQQLFVGCSNKMIVIVNPNSGRVIKSLSAGDGIDATAFDSKLNLDFISAGVGLLTVVKGGPNNQIQVVQDLKTEKGARTLAIDLKNHHIILAAGSKSSTDANPFHLIIVGQ